MTIDAITRTARAIPLIVIAGGGHGRGSQRAGCMRPAGARSDAGPPRSKRTVMSRVPGAFVGAGRVITERQINDALERAVASLSCPA